MKEKYQNERAVERTTNKRSIPMFKKNSIESRIYMVAEMYGKRISAAEQAEISTDQLLAYIKGTSKASFEPIARLAEGKGVNLNWIWSGKGEQFIPKQELSKAVNEAPEMDYQQSASDTSDVNRHSECETYIDNICSMKGYNPSAFTRDTLINLKFSSDISDKGLLILISVLKADYEDINRGSIDQTK